jgi:hypothetical protein
VRVKLFTSLAVDVHLTPSPSVFVFIISIEDVEDCDSCLVMVVGDSKSQIFTLSLMILSLLEFFLFKRHYYQIVVGEMEFNNLK